MEAKPSHAGRNVLNAGTAPASQTAEELTAGRRSWKLIGLLVAVMALIAAARGPVLKNVARGHVETGLGWMALNRYQDALDNFNQALAMDPADAEAWYQKGNAYFGLGDRNKCAEAYRSALAIRPEFAPALQRLASLDLLLQRISEAQGLLERYVRLEPRDADAWRLLADAYHQTGNHKDAIAAVTRCLLLRPASGEAYIFRADQESRNGADDRIVANDARKGLALKTDSSLGYLVLARAELHQGTLAPALNDVTRGLNLLPSDSADRVPFLLLHAQIEAKAAHPELAQKDLDEASRLQTAEQERRAKSSGLGAAPG